MVPDLHMIASQRPLCDGIDAALLCCTRPPLGADTYVTPGAVDAVDTSLHGASSKIDRRWYCAPLSSRRLSGIFGERSSQSRAKTRPQYRMR